MKLILFTSSTGLEIIGKLQSETDQHFIVERPLGFHPVQMPNLQYQIQLIPYSLANPDGFHKFSKPVVSVSMSIPSELEKTYLSTTSGIEIVSAR